jgi:16S rRNA (guanine966-N2)-methyltransferase
VKKLLRLTGGSFAGRTLYVPDRGVRPATNKVREALFSTLLTWFPEGMKGLAALDLFAGSGSLGLETISRGGERVTFVDSSHQSVRAIRMNLRLLDYRAQVVKSDVTAFLKKSSNLEYDLIFMDPPYRYTKVEKIVYLLIEALKPAEIQVREVEECCPRILVHERRYSKDLPDFGENAVLVKRRRYGQTELLYYELNPQPVIA